MKRQFSRSGNRALLSGGRIGILIVLVIVFFIFALRALAPDVFVFLSRPLLGVGSSLTAAVGSASGTFEDRAGIQEERDRLRVELEAAQNENVVLRTQLGDMTRLAAKENSISAGVIARPPVSPYDTLVVEAGSEAGVRVGALVFGTGGIPIGTIEAISGKNAHVALYSAPGRVTEGWIGEARLPVTITGAGAGAFRATLAKDAVPQIGEQVFVPGPGALPIGVVARVDTNPSLPEANLFIRPLVNPFTLTWVAIDDTAL